MWEEDVAAATATPQAILLNQKVIPPGLPARTVLRPRLNAQYSSLLESHETLAVFATAGSGKTVQAQLFATATDWPVAWITLDSADRLPSRLLTYLVAALRPHVQGIDGVRVSGFDKAAVPVDWAAAVAESIGSRKVLIVFDQCEAIMDSPEACSVVEAFLGYLPPNSRAMLLGRDEGQLSVSRLVLTGRVARVTDEELALTYEEAEALLATRSEATDDLRGLWDLSGGWVAGVAFGASRQGRRTFEDRDFRGFVEQEIYARLPTEEQRFLLETSILEAVSLDVAAELCGPAARAIWDSLASRHLPATTSSGQTIRFHPCFRSFLQSKLELEDPERMADLRGRHAELLLTSGHAEEAVELLLELGCRERALEVAALAAEQLLQRQDWVTWLRWAEAIGTDRVEADLRLVPAHIMSLRGARRLQEVRALVGRLEESGQLDAVLAADDRVLTHLAWSMAWTPDRALDLLDRYGSIRSSGARYFFNVMTSRDPVAPVHGASWSESDRMVSWALMVQGRLDELVEMLPAEGAWPPRSPYTTPHPLIGLVWRGDFSRARDLLDQVPEEFRLRVHTDMWDFVEAWLLLAEGNPGLALVSADRAISNSRDTGYGYEPVFQIVEAAALIQLGRLAQAIEVLQQSISITECTGVRAPCEWGRSMLGCAYLLRGEPQLAAAELRPVVAEMRHARRLLMLPMAAVYLAEACERLGDLDGADEAASLALAASEEMKAFWALNRALEDFPSVRHRQLWRHPEAVEWRRVGTPSTPSRLSAPGRAIPVEVHPFGFQPDIFVAGESVGLRRTKVLELLCFLIHHPSGVTRESLQLQLFPDSDRRRASNHFRQVVHQLRKATGITLTRLPNAYRVSDDYVFEATDIRLEQELAAARTATDDDRVQRLRASLDRIDGPYLANSELEWVNQRRYELDVLIVEAEIEVMNHLLEQGDVASAQERAELLIARDPYCDEAYRVLIQAHLKAGSNTAARGAYRRACEAMKEIGLTPDVSTVELMSAPAR